MLSTLHRKSLAASLAMLLTSAAATSMAADVKPAVDTGTANNSQVVNVTLVLRLHNQEQLEDYIQQTVTPGSPHYRQFLSTSEFASRYGATDAELAQVQNFLRQNGLSGSVLANHMAIRTSGTLAQFSAAFQTPIHSFTSKDTGRSFHRPTQPLILPAQLTNTLLLVSGLSNEHKYLSHVMKSVENKPVTAVGAKALARSTLSAPASKGGNSTATGVPGEFTVGDVANMYNINPLYARGVNGQGSTIAIVTLSNFYPDDAQTYWNDIGLITKPNRITQVHVDGGGAIDAGSGETSLDVEQSGGVAPFADILVYDAPNAGTGFTDAFMQAVVDNKADAISTSWGLPEIFNFAALNVAGASNTDTTDAGDLQTFHQILLEAAVQGQSTFAASADSGAYDTVRGLGAGTAPGTFNAPLTVDSPASDPYITAAGGTTVPFSSHFGSGPVQSITKERVWGWDYIQNYFDTYIGKGVIDVFSVGGGGGVSVYWQTPVYQWFTNGIRRSEKKQTLSFNDPAAGETTLLVLPGNFQGRNVPDVALNADPETGYLMVSTVDGGLVAGHGGTSFVAPQLNGIAALLTQSTGHRVGFLNPQMYFLQNVFGYGKYSSFNDIRDGDNWYYNGKPGYDRGTGLGTLNVTNLDLFLRSGF
ncbi:S53 family peptidase [Dyella japonica]|uniref:Peptidase S53 n=1 Tax=Dyella japonica A8 TaxID=1217721 RepID=A0A075JYY5_9GAMM|nr:S53 family peptidase [Dyella japonica]AIF47104.1 peptidase S53 [Dyella japonica A8]